MKATYRVRDGFVAGLIAGVVVAVLFVFYDLGQRVPLRTPTLFWTAVTRQVFMGPTTVGVIGYAVIHSIVWAGLGGLAALFVRWLRLPVDLLIGSTYGLLLSSLVFYFGVNGATKGLVLSMPGWPAVFVANGVGGAVMFMYMEWSRSGLDFRRLMKFLRPTEVTRQGLYTGLMGGGVVALWFLILDVVLREPLYTPSALGMILFRAGVGTGIGSVDAAVIPALGYGIWHFAFFTLLGVLMCVHLDSGTKGRSFLLQLLCVSLLLDLSVVVIVVSLESWILRELTWWAIFIGNGFSAAAMGGYLFKQSPQYSEGSSLGGS